ncbi:LamG-like jellyroll fold domain-containing protein [Lentisalinibacter sediminis]|uniref:LamG-like jellyroll fold domain-containing protein n=1 Tax=Lentisalinibacter sediminis TaxID=2992237 RepID=UPI003864CDB8
MRRLAKLTVIGVGILLAGMPAAHELPGGLILHLPFDGSLQNQGSLPLEVQTIAAGGEPTSSPEFREGKYGQSVFFPGDKAIRLPLDINYELYPQLTISAWVYVEGDGNGYIVSNRSPTGPTMTVGSRAVGAKGPRAQISETAVRPDRWLFVAAVWDKTAGTMRLHYDRRSETAELAEKSRPGEIDLWVGAWDDTLQGVLKNVRIDDLRIYDQALTPEQLEGLWMGQSVATSRTRTQAITSQEINAQSGAGTAAGDDGQTAITPGQVQYDPGQVSDDELNPNLGLSEPGDQDALRTLPGDQYDTQTLPGDQYDPQKLPGDQYDPQTLPGDQYDPQALPGDQYDRQTGDSSLSDAEAFQRLREQQEASSAKDGSSGTASRASLAGNLPTTSEVESSIEQQLDSEDDAIFATGDSELEQMIREGSDPATVEGSSVTSGSTTATDETSTDTTRRIVGWKFGDERYQSAISGKKGDIVKPHEFGGDKKGFNRLAVWETNNVPCRVLLYSWSEIAWNTNQCDWALSLSQELDVSIGNSTVTAISVCSSENSISKNRVKGINIRGHRILSDGSFGTYREDTEKHTNCVEPWHMMTACGVGDAATGLVAHFDTRSGSEELVGLSLYCRKVVPIYE